VRTLHVLAMPAQEQTICEGIRVCGEGDIMNNIVFHEDKIHDNGEKAASPMESMKTKSEIEVSSCIDKNTIYHGDVDGTQLKYTTTR